MIYFSEQFCGAELRTLTGILSWENLILHGMLRNKSKFFSLHMYMCNVCAPSKTFAGLPL